MSPTPTRIAGASRRPSRWAFSVLCAAVPAFAAADTGQDRPASTQDRVPLFDVPGELPPGPGDVVHEAIAGGLEFLARDLTTQASGRVSLGAQDYEAPVGLTALAALAFMAGGNSPTRGPHQRSLVRTLDYLLEHQVPAGERAEGFISATEDLHSRMHGHGLAVLALTQAYTLSPQSARGRRIAEAVRAGVRRIEEAQGPDGGWFYDPLPVDLTEGSVTVCVLQALRGARNCGFQVDSDVIARAIAYVKSLQDEDGGFMYSKQQPTTSVALTGACLATLHAIGIYRGREVENGYLYVWKELAVRDDQRAQGLFGSASRFPFYERFYLAQALWQNPDEAVFRRWWSDEMPRLVTGQRDDGSWPDTRYDGAGRRIEGRYGSAYATSMNVLVLSVPEGTLPIFQR